MKNFITALIVAMTSFMAQAQTGMREMPLGRGDAFMPVYVSGTPQAVATLVLLPGGQSGTGRIQDGEPRSTNFLVRSRDLFKAEGFNVVIAFRPSDLKELDFPYRTSRAHVEEIDKVIELAAREFGKPVWLVGTSRGTVSGTAAALALGPKVAGLVLTSSITSRAPGAVPSQDIGNLRIPVLVVHHQRDACMACVPYEARRMTASFKAAPVKKFIMIEGGSAPEGDPCEPLHWHGFIHYERETVKLMTDWIKNPQP